MTNIRYTKLIIVALSLSLCFAMSARTVDASETCKIAVASNFSTTAKTLSKHFDTISGHRTLLSFGSSGKLFAQISHGAPFDVFLSADAERPDALIEQGLAVSGSDVTYALGRLALWSPSREVNSSILNKLPRIVLANPKTAPYGIAAKRLLKHYRYQSSVQSKLVFADNVAQAMQFVASGNADAGFISLAQIYNLPKEARAYWWLAEENTYPTLQQKAVLLKPGEKRSCASEYLTYLKSAPATQLIKQMGYNLPL